MKRRALKQTVELIFGMVMSVIKVLKGDTASHSMVDHFYNSIFIKLKCCNVMVCAHPPAVSSAETLLTTGNKFKVERTLHSLVDSSTASGRRTLKMDHKYLPAHWPDGRATVHTAHTCTQSGRGPMLQCRWSGLCWAAGAAP